MRSPGPKACALAQALPLPPSRPAAAFECCSWFRSREWVAVLAWRRPSGVAATPGGGTAASPAVDGADALATPRSAMQASPGRRSFGSGGPGRVVLVGRSGVRGKGR